MIKALKSYSEEWFARDRRAAKIFEIECRANGALMPFGFGFLSEAAREPYRAQAELELAPTHTEGRES
jgi:hypothetical protein